MQWKVPQNGNVGGLHDSKLLTFLIFIIFQSFSSSQNVYCYYAFRPRSLERLLVMNVYCTIRKMIPLFCFVSLLRPSISLTPFYRGRTVGAGPKGVCLRESWLYYHSKRESGVMGQKVGQRKNCKNGKGTCFSFRCLFLWRPRVLTIYTN